MSVFNDIGTTISGWLKDNVKIRSIKKEDLQKLIKSNTESHDNIADLLSKFARMVDKQTLMDYRTRATELENKIPSADIYDIFVHKLDNRSQQLEARSFLASLEKAHGAMKKILPEVAKNLDTLVTGDSINVFNTRVSSLAILGVLRQSDILIDWTYYMWAQYIQFVTSQLEDPKGYRPTYLIQHVDTVASAVMDIVNQTGVYVFLKEATALKQKNADMVLNFTTPGASSIMDLVIPGNYSLGFLSNLGSALSVLNILRHVQERWDNWQDLKYRKNKDMHAWMINQVAYLRYRSMDMSPDDPKCVTLQKVIAKYDDLIAEYAEKINRYETGD